MEPQATHRHKSSLHLIDTILEEIQSQKFIDSHKSSPQDFTRASRLDFSTLFWQLLQSNKSYSSTMRTSFNFDNLTPFNAPTKQAYCQARKKINPSAFSAISKTFIKGYYDSVNPQSKKFCNLRAIGVDGSIIRLEDSAYQDMISHYKNMGIDLSKSIEKEQASSARCSLLYDVYNEISIDGQLKPTMYSEMEMLIEQLCAVGPGDVLVMDRGYNAYWFYAILDSLDIKFVIRAQTSHSVVKKFIESGEEDALVKLKRPTNITSSKRHKALIEQYGIGDVKSLDLRLIRYDIDDQNDEPITYVMITNLRDKELYPASEFKDLYKARWRIEEGFKTYKVSVEIERWSGISWFTALQDFHSTILLTNITRIYSFEVDEKIKNDSAIKVQNKELKYLEKLNITEAVRSFRSLVQNIIKKTYFECEKHITGFQETIKAFKTLIRDGRRFSYARKNGGARYYMNCKLSN